MFSFYSLASLSINFKPNFNRNKSKTCYNNLPSTFFISIIFLPGTACYFCLITEIRSGAGGFDGVASNIFNNTKTSNVHNKSHSSFIPRLKERENRKLGWKVLILKYDLGKSLSKEM